MLLKAGDEYQVFQQAPSNNEEEQKNIPQEGMCSTKSLSQGDEIGGRIDVWKKMSDIDKKVQIIIYIK